MKRGFTLIELLAVIVILAIIAFIATPLVLDIINDFKLSSTNISANSILKATNLYYSNSDLTGEVVINKNIYEEVLEDVKGQKPDNGSIYVNNNGKVALALKYNDYCYTKGYTDKEIKVKKTDTCIAPIDYLKPQDQTNDASIHFFEGPIAKSSVEKVVTLTTNIVPEEAKENSWDVSEAQNGSIMAWYLDEDGNELFELYIGQEGGVKANPDSSKLFNSFINATEIDLSNLDTSNVTTMRAMFQDCQSLEKLNITNFNTSNVINMTYMFNFCLNIKELDLSHFNTSNVIDMESMFKYCEKLEKLNISSFNTTKVTNMSLMFAVILNLENLDLSHFNTSNVIDMESMFRNCEKLTNLNISNFDMSVVTQYDWMFNDTPLSNIIVKDNEAKTFIEARLTDAGITATVTVN